MNDEETILIEVSSAGAQGRVEGTAYRGPRGDQIKEFSRAQVAKALSVVRLLAEETRHMVADLQAAPGNDDLANVEVSFGLTFTGETTAYVVKAGGEASMTVKLVWEPKKG